MLIKIMIEQKIIVFLQKINLVNFFIPITCLSSSPILIISLIFLYYFKIINLDDIKKIIFGSIILKIIKELFKRKRPFQSTNLIKNLSYKIPNDYSFPSGHSMFAFLITKIIVSKNPNLKILYLIPILIAISRIYLGVHYLSDIIIGSFLGYYI